MSRNYYFLVSGLADLVLDDAKSGGAFVDFMNEIMDQIGPADQQLLRCIRLPFDNANLIALVLDTKREFDNRGNFSRDELLSALRNPDELPLYMQTFLDAHKENRQLFPGHIAEDQLAWLFYDEMSANRNKFIREWFVFDRDLRNIITGLTCRKELEHIDALATDRDRSASSLVIGDDDIAEAVARSNAVDFGLAGTLPWLDKILQVSRTSLSDYEKAIDTLRWDTLNDMTTFSYFSIETVLAFAIKLLMVERWRVLDPVKGKERLDLLVEELKAGFTMPAGFSN